MTSNTTGATPLLTKLIFVSVTTLISATSFAGTNCNPLVQKCNSNMISQLNYGPVDNQKAIEKLRKLDRSIWDFREQLYQEDIRKPFLGGQGFVFDFKQLQFTLDSMISNFGKLSNESGALFTYSTELEAVQIAKELGFNPSESVISNADGTFSVATDMGAIFDIQRIIRIAEQTQTRNRHLNFDETDKMTTEIQIKADQFDGMLFNAINVIKGF